MTDPAGTARPLLAFPVPRPGTIPTAAPRPPGRPIAGPSAQRQGERLGPRFAALQDALAHGRISDEGPVAETDPELIVVFEVAGDARDFARACTRVPGLEFLAELHEPDADPDDDFHVLDADGDPTSAPVARVLYLALSNATAVGQLVTLFERWQADPDAKLAHGLAPLRAVFTHLRDVRRWSAADRVRDSGLLETWQETLEVIGGSQSSTRVEIDLGYRADSARRAASQARISEVLARSGGQLITSATVEQIRYHGVLAELPHRAVAEVLAEGPESLELLTADEVMFVAPVRAMALTSSTPAQRPLPDDPDTSNRPLARSAPPPARIGVLDGLALSNHPALAGWVLIDDPDDRSADYPVDQRHHGTAIVSLICHGDLADPRRGDPLDRPIYLRPILHPDPAHPGHETVVGDELFVDLLHRSFRRMFEGDAAEPPAAPGVRIVNLSVGDPARVFVRDISPAARMLDWLAQHYNVLIIVSAGNRPPDLAIPAAALTDPQHTQREVLAGLLAQARQRRVLAPAEAVNVLTVGALHDDAGTDPFPDTVIDPLAPGLPALYTPVGFGLARSVKPEVLAAGGRTLLQRPPPAPDPQQPVDLRAAPAAARGPGLLVSAPSVAAGNATGHIAGTSFAAALTSRAADHIFDVLEDTAPPAGPFPLPDAQYHPVLAKALLVHTARWGGIASTMRRIGPDPQQPLSRRDLTQLLGYGAVELDDLASAARTRAVLIGAGTIVKDQRQRFEFPLPASLASSAIWRRLTVTLAWFSPISPLPGRHRAARLRIDPPTEQIGAKRVEADWNTVVKGTVQHEILEGTDAVAYLDGAVLAINVDCRIDLSAATAPPVRYGLAVSLEVAVESQIDLHQEVVAGLIQARQRIRTQART